MAAQFLKFKQQSYYVNYEKMNLYFNFEFLHKMNIDISVGPFLLTSQNQLCPIKFEYYDMFMREPNPQLMSTYFLKVYAIELWLCVVAMLIVITGWILVHHKLNKLKISCAIESIFNTFGISTKSEPLKISSVLSINTFNTVASIFCFFIAASFSAFLISKLSSKDYKIPFTGLENFWNQNNYGLCIWKFDYVHFFVMDRDPERRLLNNKLCEHMFDAEYKSLYNKLCDRPQVVHLAISEMFDDTKNRYNPFN